MLGFAACGVVGLLRLLVRHERVEDVLLPLLGFGYAAIDSRDLVRRVMLGRRLAWIQAGHRLPPGGTP